VADASLGLAWQDNTQKSTYISNIDGLRHGMKQNFDSWRLFTAAGLSKFWMVDKWLISARFGAMYLHQENAPYTLRGTDALPFANDSVSVNKNLSDLFQLSLGGRAAYRIGNFSPFVGATYVQDVAKSGRQKDFVGANFQAGFNYRVNAFSMGLTGIYGVRDHYQNAGGMLNFRWDF